MSWSSSLYLNPEHSDVSVVFEGDTSELSLPAHSFVLRCRSKVFDVMLGKDSFKEGSAGTVALKGVKINVAKAFLKFLYTDTLGSCAESQLIDLILAADMYDIPQLVSCCDTQLASKITPENACFLYQSLFRTSHKPVKSLENCLTIMCAGAEVIFECDGFLDLEEDALRSFLSDDQVNVNSEKSVLNALWRWGQHQCRLQSLEEENDNIMHCIDNVLECVRMTYNVELKKTLKELVDSQSALVQVAASPREGIIQPSVIWRFSKVISFGNRPLLFKTQSIDVTSYLRLGGGETMSTLTSEHPIFLLGFHLTLYANNIGSGVNDYMLSVNKEKYPVREREVIRFEDATLSQITIVLHVPLKLVPGKTLSIFNCSSSILYYHSKDYEVYQKRTNLGLLTVKTLKDMACTFHLISSL